MPLTVPSSSPPDRPGPSRPPAEDLDLVRRVQDGDLDAFEPLYREHVDRIYALCLRMSGDPVAATELTQDVFVHCWERIGSFRGESRFSTWLHRVAVNVVLEAGRRAGRRDARVTATDDVARHARGELPHHEARMDLETAIQTLPPKAREVFVLHDIEGYRHREIAELTGSAPGTLRAQLHRARRLLMEVLR